MHSPNENDTAWQSGLVLEETAEWNTSDWPTFEHVSVVLNHRNNHTNDDNNKAQTVVVVMGGYPEQSAMSTLFWY